MSYYNTTNEIGAELSASIQTNDKQETIVLSMFKRVAEWQPSHIFQLVGKYPITSIRRTLTDLTSSGYLIKTEEKRLGLYGKREHVWKLKTND
jgi:lipopolysaccharide/colanic/teichoic acid biosynthesis glycosyltransferase